MARTIEQIRNEIISAKEARAELSQLNSTSQVSVWRLLVDIVATSIWTLEKLFDIFKMEVNDTIARLKPHTTRFYAEKSLAFQFGYDLVPETDTYDNTGIADDVVAASKVVSYAAVVEQVRGVRIKVARTVGDDLGPLTTDQLNAFKEYIRQIKDAGVRVNITSTDADRLRVVLRIRYNPLVLSNIGGRLDGETLHPVKDALKEHLKNLPFNGVFSVQKMVDAIQAVEGVEDLNVDEVQTSYGLLNLTSVSISRIPDSGYLRIADADFIVTYEAI